MQNKIILDILARGQPLDPAGALPLDPARGQAPWTPVVNPRIPRPIIDIFSIFRASRPTRCAPNGLSTLKIQKNINDGSCGRGFFC